MLEILSAVGLVAAPLGLRKVEEERVVVPKANPIIRDLNSVPSELRFAPQVWAGSSDDFVCAEMIVTTSIQDQWIIDAFSEENFSRLDAECRNLLATEGLDYDDMLSALGACLPEAFPAERKVLSEEEASLFAESDWPS